MCFPVDAGTILWANAANFSWSYSCLGIPYLAQRVAGFDQCHSNLPPALILVHTSHTQSYSSIPSCVSAYKTRSKTQLLEFWFKSSSICFEILDLQRISQIAIAFIMESYQCFSSSRKRHPHGGTESMISSRVPFVPLSSEAMTLVPQ